MPPPHSRPYSMVTRQQYSTTSVQPPRVATPVAGDVSGSVLCGRALSVVVAACGDADFVADDLVDEAVLFGDAA
jgi:hypothetical protein